MFSTIGATTRRIDERMAMIESNKGASCAKEIIIQTNTKLLNKIKMDLADLEVDSCNKTLKAKYSKIIEQIKVI